MTDKIRFLHIPKTAGSTFDECLFVQYLGSWLLRRQFVFSGNLEADQQRYQKLSPAARSRIVICTGHAPRLTACAELDALPTITLLRHPVERVKSLCQHISEGKSVKINGNRAGDFDLDELLESGRIQLNNFQSRMLLGRQGFRLPRGSNTSLATRATEVLASELRCFGLTEDFDRSLLLFRQVLGWRKLPVYRSRNRKNPRALLSFQQRHLDRIEQLNTIDIELYDKARALFYQRLGQQCPDIEKDLVQLRSALARPSPAFAAIDLARTLARVYRGSPS